MIKFLRPSLVPPLFVIVLYGDLIYLFFVVVCVCVWGGGGIHLTDSMFLPYSNPECWKFIPRNSSK